MNTHINLLTYILHSKYYIDRIIDGQFIIEIKLMKRFGYNQTTSKQ